MEFKELAAQLQEGAVESEGRFTLDSSRADSKFQKQVALQPHLFLGRLVQVANVSDASEIRFDILSDKISVQIFPADDSPLLKLLDYFEQKDVPGGPVFQYLNDAIGCAKALKPKRLKLSLRGTSGDFSVNCLKGKIDYVATTAGRPALSLEFQTPPRPWRFLERWFSKLTHIQSMVEFMTDGRLKTPEDYISYRCCFSAVPVWLNGKLLQFRPFRADQQCGLPEHHDLNWPSWVTYRLIQMDLVDNRLPKSHWINGPTPSVVRAERAVINDRSFGMDAAVGEQSISVLDIKRTSLLSIVVPSLASCEAQEPAWSVDRRECAGLSWNSAQKLSGIPLLCGRWGLVGEGKDQSLGLVELDFLELNKRFVQESPVAGDQDQLCCSSFLGVRPLPDLGCFIPVKDGLALSPESPRDWPSGTFVVATVPDLKVDLNGTNVIRDEAYEQMVSTLKGKLAALSQEGGSFKIQLPEFLEGQLKNLAKPS